MNKYSLVGKVSYFQVQEYAKEDRTIKKISWILGSKNGNQFNNLPCETWNHSFEGLADGMIIELTEYIPKNNRYQDKTTGQYKSRFVLDVKEARVVFEDEVSGRGLISDKPQSQSNTFINEPQNVLKTMGSFDVKKEVEKLMEEVPVEEEDLIDLEWEEETKKEWEEQQKETIEMLDKELDTKNIVEEVLEKSIKTSILNVDKLIEQTAKNPMSPQEIEKMNDIPKIQEETSYEGDINVAGARIITKENEEW